MQKTLRKLLAAHLIVSKQSPQTVVRKKTFIRHHSLPSSTLLHICSITNTIPAMCRTNLLSAIALVLCDMANKIEI